MDQRKHKSINIKQCLESQKHLPKTFERLACEGCDGIPINPVQCQNCKRLFCQEYVKQEEPCPNCIKAVQFGGDQNIARSDQSNQILHRPHVEVMTFTEDIDQERSDLLRALQLMCENYNRGCKQVLTHEEYGQHIEHCLTTCKHCKRTFCKDESAKHDEQCQAYKDFLLKTQAWEEDFDLKILQSEKNAEEFQTKLQQLQNEVAIEEAKESQSSRKLWFLTILSLLLFTAICIIMFVLLRKEPLIQYQMSDSARLIDRLKKDKDTNYFNALDQDMWKHQYEIRVQDLINELHTNGTGPQKLFKIDKLQDQLTPKSYYQEVFYQLFYLINQLEKNPNNQIQDCPPSHKKQQRIGKQCIQSIQNNADLIKQAKNLARAFTEGFISGHDRKEVRDFISKLSHKIEDMSINRQAKSNIQGAIERLRKEIRIA